MTNSHGDFIWYELMTSDADAAQAFYGGLIGWTFKDSGNPDMDYRLFSAGATEVGGVMPLTPEMLSGGAHPAWIGYIGVDNVDATADAIKATGGSIHMEPWDVPGVGRLCMVADPQGALFYLMKGLSDDPEHASTSFAKYAPMVGHCAWNELASSDPEAAKAFYGEQFGWVKGGELDMGPMGKYEFIMTSGERPYGVGAVMPLMPGMPMSMWTYYFRVPDIDKAVEYTKANGGQILQEPMEIPGGEFSFNAMDPQEAAFGLVGPRV
jgi:uncharacterized protein